MSDELDFQDFEELDLGNLLGDIKEEEPQPEPVEDVDEDATPTEKKQYYVSVQLRRRVARVDPSELWKCFEEGRDPIWLVYGNYK